MRENYTPKLHPNSRFRLFWFLFRPLWSGVGLGTEKNVRLSLFEVTLKVLVPLLFTGIAHAQIAIPYTETFAGITAANGFPTVTGGAWSRTTSTTLQPTYITNQTTYNRQGNNDTKFMSFRYGNTTAAYYMVGPFNLTAGTSYTSSVLYRADGLNGFGPLEVTPEIDAVAASGVTQFDGAVTTCTV